MSAHGGPVPGRLAITPTGGRLLVGCALLGGLTLLTGNRWLLLLAGAGAGLVVHALLSRPRLDHVVVEAPATTRLVVGGEGVVACVVGSTAGPELAPLQVVLHVDQQVAGGALVGPLAPGSPVAVDLEVVGDVRERLTHLDAVVLSVDPLGLARRARVVHVPGEVVVHPAPRRPEPVPVGLGGSPDGAGTPRPSPGPDLLGVRDWRAGDGSRGVHWRSTARRGRLVVAERGETQRARWLVGLTATSGAASTEELLARAAATCVAGLADGVRLSVLAWPDGPGSALAGAAEPVAAPTGGRLPLLDWFSGLTSFRVPAPDELVRAVPPGTRTLVLLDAPEVDAAWWRRVGALAAPLGLAVHRVRS